MLGRRLWAAEIEFTDDRHNEGKRRINDKDDNDDEDDNNGDDDDASESNDVDASSVRSPTLYDFR